MPRMLQGTIVSNRMTKTVVVRVDRLRLHPKYRTYQRVSQKFKAAVEDAGSYRIGDIVRIGEVRPLSKEKRWKVLEIVWSVPVETPDADVEESGEPVPS